MVICAFQQDGIAEPIPQAEVNFQQKLKNPDGLHRGFNYVILYNGHSITIPRKSSYATTTE